MPNGIVIFGANGSGKTTLGRELAHNLNYKHMDVEDYHFEKSDIPYTVERTREECIELMLSDIEKHHSFVLTAVTGDFDDEIHRYYELAVYLSAPLEVRIERIKQREYEKHGERICEGGDMYKQHIKFVDFVGSRSLSGIELYAETLSCPIIHVDGTVDLLTNITLITEKLKQIKKNLDKPP